jgi:hydroxymethylglutaryl-CoA lyase
MKETPIIHITETPRDAMQGWSRLIPARAKADYINQLLKVGFDVVDAGSFVSPKAVPQMADTEDVLSLLHTKMSRSKIMVIVGNSRGGLQAATKSSIDIVGFPHSVSPTFLSRNINSTPEAAWKTIVDLDAICSSSGKTLQVYLAMSFGNPYGDDWSDELVLREAERLSRLGIQRLAFSDITGEGSPDSIGRLSAKLLNLLPAENLSLHLHSHPHDWQPKVEAAWQAGFRNFEGALGGFGGCPMTGYELLGNLDTARLANWCTEMEIPDGLDRKALEAAQRLAKNIFT